MNERPETADYSEPLDYWNSEVMTIEEYLENVEAGALTDYDGMGEAVKDGKQANAEYNKQLKRPRWILPSDGDRFIPKDATHIAWYNR